MVKELPNVLPRASTESALRSRSEAPPVARRTSDTGQNPRTVRVGLRNSPQWLAAPAQGALKQASPPGHLRFGSPENIYEAIFPEGVMPRRGAESDRMAQLLGQLVEEAERIPGAMLLLIGMHGVWVEPGSTVLRRADAPDVADLVALLRDPERPAQAPTVSAPKPAPSAPELALARGSTASVLRAAHANLRQADKLVVAMRDAQKALNQLHEHARLRGMTPALLAQISQLQRKISTAGAEARIAINGACNQAKRHDDAAATADILRRAALRLAEVVVAELAGDPLPPERAEESLRLIAEVLEHDPQNTDAHRLRAWVHLSRKDRPSALACYLDALRAVQKQRHPNDPPAILDNLPLYDDVWAGHYRAVLDTLPRDAPLKLRKAILLHVQHLNALEKERSQPVVRHGDRLPGPLGGSAKNPRTAKSQQQNYVVSAPTNASLARATLEEVLEVLHDNTVARGFASMANPGERLELQCGFNRLVVRREGITVEDFDGEQRVAPAENSYPAVARLCSRMQPGTHVVVMPRFQHVRSETAECYVRYVNRWSNDHCSFRRGDDHYRLEMGTRDVPGDEAQRTVGHATARILGAVNDLCKGLGIGSEKFARCVVQGNAVHITPHYKDVEATPMVRSETRRWIEEDGVLGMNDAEIKHLAQQIRDCTPIPSYILEPGNVPEKLQATYNAIMAAHGEVAGLLPKGRMELTTPEPAAAAPRLYNRSGYRLWYPYEDFALINQELYVRDLGQMHGWGDQFEAKLMRLLGIHVRIWEPEGTFIPAFTNKLKRQEDTGERENVQGPVVNVMRKGQAHYVTLPSVKENPDDPDHASARRYVDNPGGGDCFFYAVLNAARRVCPDKLPQSVRNVMDMEHDADEKAVKALRAALQQVIMEKLDTDPEFVADLNSHLKFDEYSGLDYFVRHGGPPALHTADDQPHVPFGMPFFWG